MQKIVKSADEEHERKICSLTCVNCKVECTFHPTTQQCFNVGGVLQEGRIGRKEEKFGLEKCLVTSSKCQNVRGPDVLPEETRGAKVSNREENST